MQRPSPARLAAARVLERVEAEGAFAPIALAAELRTHRLKPREKSQATDIVYGVLRWRGRLDFYLQRFSKRRLASLSPWVKGALRIGAFHLLFHEHVPARAALSESVELAKVKERYAAGYVNGVLRAFLAGRDAVRFPDPAEDPAGYLEAWGSHPRWLAERWIAAWGFDGARALVEADNAPAGVTLRVNVARASVDEVREKLARSGVEALPGRLAPHALRIRGEGSVEDLPGFAEGLFYVQDEGSQLVGWAATTGEGGRVADLCAAPGGKATHLAELWAARRGERGPGGETGGLSEPPVAAFDVNGRRAGLVLENAKRLGLERLIRVHVRDAREVRPEEFGRFSRVLVDAPCTGTGVLRRRPDLRWQKGPEDIAALVIAQREILASAARLVEPGGSLVYSTCSLEPEENFENARWFLERFPEFRPWPLAGDLPEPARSRIEKGRFALEGAAVQLAPHLDDADGIFIFRTVHPIDGK